MVEGDDAWKTISEYVEEVAPDLRERVSHWESDADVFAVHRIDEQLAKGMDRKVWLPSGGSLVIDRTEAMTVVDVNTGKFTGSGGTLEETVTRNNLEAAEEIVRQLRLRDIGGIIVIDFIDMVLESNRDLVLRRLVECLGRDRTRHQVAEVTSLGLVQMTRKRVGQGLVEAFSETCEHCHGPRLHRARRADREEQPASRRRRPAAAAATAPRARPSGHAASAAAPRSRSRTSRTRACRSCPRPARRSRRRSRRSPQPLPTRTSTTTSTTRRLLSPAAEGTGAQRTRVSTCSPSSPGRRRRSPSRTVPSRTRADGGPRRRVRGRQRRDHGRETRRERNRASDNTEAQQD